MKPSIAFLVLFGLSNALDRRTDRMDASSTTSGFKRGPIEYFLGNVLSSTIEINLIFYGDAWKNDALLPKDPPLFNLTQSARIALIQKFVKNVGSSAFTDTLKPYWDLIDSKQGNIKLGQTLFLPYSETQQPHNLPTGAMKQMLESLFNKKMLTYSPNSIYVILTDPNVRQCDGIENNKCADLYACGWHSFYNRYEFATSLPSKPFKANNVHYTWVGDGISGCAIPRLVSPHDAVTDGLISAISHEVFETITDPSFQGYIDAVTGFETSDNCAWNFGVADTIYADQYAVPSYSFDAVINSVTGKFVEEGSPIVSIDSATLTGTFFMAAKNVTLTKANQNSPTNEINTYLSKWALSGKLTSSQLNGYCVGSIVWNAAVRTSSTYSNGTLSLQCNTDSNNPNQRKNLTSTYVFDGQDWTYQIYLFRNQILSDNMPPKYHYNIKLDGEPYLIQQEWDLNKQNCTNWPVNVESRKPKVKSN